MQRYGAFLWSGDVYSTWETLKTHVPVAVNTGLSGIPFWGTDIGGFVPTPEYTGELHVRWFQFGTFCPSFRAHGRNVAPATAVGLEHGQARHLGELRSYTGGAGDPDPSASCATRRSSRSCKKYLELRYRLLPYTYTTARECCETGPADDARALAALSRRSAGRSLARRPVPLGPRHPRLAGRREGGDVAAAVSAARATGTTSGPRSAVDGGREIERASIWRRCRCTFARARSCRSAPVKQYVDEPVDGPAVARRLPGRGRRVRDVRRRREDVRLSQGRVDAASRWRGATRPAV